MKLNQFLYIFTPKANAHNWESIGWIHKPSLFLIFLPQKELRKKENQFIIFVQKKAEKQKKKLKSFDCISNRDSSNNINRSN